MLVLKYHPAYQKDASLLDLLFPIQREAFESTELLNAIQCTRRAGKSYGCALKMVHTGMKHEGAIIPYVTLTGDSGKNIIAPVLREIKELYNAPIEERKDGKEWIICPERKRPSKIMVHGADQKNFLDRLRGPKYPEVFIDEAASFRRTLLETMVDEIFTPAVGDYNGQIYLIGTPGPIPEGYFYDASQGKNGFKRFFWRVNDNPYFKDPQGFMDDLLARKNWTRDTPKFRREWLGEWVLDSDSLVYKFNEERNIIEELPTQFKEWRYIIGVDVGFHDQTAFSIICYSPGSSNVYIFQTIGFSQMIPYDAAQELIRLSEYFEPDSIVMDTGGLGKSIAAEFSARYHIPVKAAEKTDKMGHIEMFNNDLQTGKMKVIRENNEELIHQWKTLQKLENGKEDPSVMNDRCFKSGTLIETSHGSIPIEGIAVGDFVMTRKGYKRVSHVWNNGKKPVIGVKLSNGKTTWCTENHPYYADGKFSPSNSLLYGQRLYSIKECLKQKPSNTGHQVTVVGLVRPDQPILEEVFNLSVEDYPEYFADGVLVHNCDAALYAWRESLHFTFQPSEPYLNPNTDAYMEKQWKKIEQKIHQEKNQESDPVMDFLR